MELVFRLGTDDGQVILSGKMSELSRITGIDDVLVHKFASVTVTV